MPYTKVFSIFPTYCVEYLQADQWELLNRASTCLKPPKRETTGAMSKDSRKKLMNGIQWLKLFSPRQTVYCKQQNKRVTFNLNFITLTLSQEQFHPDEFIKEHLLQPFLKWIQRKGAIAWVWKAESQVNGRIHFHITTNTYIYWKSIRLKWNQLQHNYGYLKDYFAEHGNHDPNSTDVHAVRNDREIGGYIVKYFGKADTWADPATKDKSTLRVLRTLGNHPSRYIDEHLKSCKIAPIIKREVEGRKWSMSNNLTNIRLQLTENIPDYMPVTAGFLNAQQYNYKQLDFAKLWTYPNICDSKAPEVIVKRLVQLKTMLTNES